MVEIESSWPSPRVGYPNSMAATDICFLDACFLLRCKNKWCDWYIIFDIRRLVWEVTKKVCVNVAENWILKHQEHNFKNRLKDWKFCLKKNQKGIGNYVVTTPYSFPGLHDNLNSSMDFTRTTIWVSQKITLSWVRTLQLSNTEVSRCWVFRPLQLSNAKVSRCWILPTAPLMK